MKVGTGELTRTDAQQIVSPCQQRVAADEYAVLPVGSRELTLAQDWLRQFTTPLRPADALHLATAFANELELLTAARAIARPARHVGVRHRLIR
jgi:predicted nucleic acid-binding protein